MKKCIYTLLALAAVSMLGSCGHKGDKSSAVRTATATVIEDEPDAALCLPVTADAGRDTIFECGGEKLPMRLVDRLYKASDDRYLSLSMMMPDKPSPLNTALMALVDTSFYYYTDASLPAHGVIDTPAAATDQFGRIGKEFITVLAPEAEAVGGNGGFNITIAARPVYTDGRYITYQIYSEAYTGGAHPVSSYYYTTYDSSSGMEMGLNHLVPAGDMTRVRNELVAALADRYNLSVSDYLRQVNDYIMPDRAACPDGYTAATFPVCNVARVAQGYVFSYPEGEIGPYSDGNIVVTVNAAGA